MEKKIIYRVKAGTLYLPLEATDGEVVKYRPGDVVVESWPGELKPAWLNQLERVTPEHDPEQEPTLMAVHKGRGRWAVINTITGLEVNDSLLSREEAERLAEAGVQDANMESPEDLVTETSVHRRRGTVRQRG